MIMVWLILAFLYTLGAVCFQLLLMYDDGGYKRGQLQFSFGWPFFVFVYTPFYLLVDWIRRAR